MNMPRRLSVETHLTEAEIQARFKASVAVKERAHWQVIWLVLRGRPVSEVAEIVGYTPNWVRLLVGRYNRGGPEALGDKRGSAGGSNALWNDALCAQATRVLEGPVPPEWGGGVWSGVKLSQWLGQQLGRPVHRARGSAALRALGYVCQRPRPRHVLADFDEQEAFKKNSPCA